MGYSLIRGRAQGWIALTALPELRGAKALAGLLRVEQSEVELPPIASAGYPFTCLNACSESRFRSPSFAHGTAFRRYLRMDSLTPHCGWCWAQASIDFAPLLKPRSSARRIRFPQLWLILIPARSSTCDNAESAAAHFAILRPRKARISFRTAFCRPRQDYRALSRARWTGVSQTETRPTDPLVLGVCIDVRPLYIEGLGYEVATAAIQCPSSHRG